MGHPIRGFVVSLFLGVVHAVTAVAASVPSDPIAGKWWGTAGPPARERVEVGLEFRRNEKGELILFLTQPLSNYFSLEAGVAKRDGSDRRVVTVEGQGLSLTLVGDRLEGFYPGPNSPASFTRLPPAQELPTEPPVPSPPAVPTGPGPRWQTRLSGQVFATPAIADGIVYVGTTGGVFQAIRAQDGELVWTFPAGRPIFGEAAIQGDAVYFVCDNGYLFKLSRDTGKEIWRHDLGDGRVSRVLAHPTVFEWDWQAPKPALADGAVYVGAGDGGFHAVDAANGTRRWRFAATGKIRTGALTFETPDGPRVAFAGEDHLVHVLDRRSGIEVWKHDTGAPVDSTPVLAGDRLLVGNRGAGLVAIDWRSGERRWRTYFWGSWVESTPVVVDGTIYIGSSDLRRVSAIDPAEGRVLWRTDVFGWTWGTPLVTGDRIYAAAAGGAPYFLRHVASFNVLDRKSGRIVERWPLPEVAGAHQWGIAGSPVLAADTIVVTTIDGSVMGFPVR